MNHKQLALKFRTPLVLAGCALAAITLFYACAKDNKAPGDPEPAPVTSAFTWTLTGGSGLSAEDSYFVEAYNNIVALRDGTSTAVDITLADNKSGTYSVSSTLGNQLDYTTGGKTYSASSGQVVIQYDGAKISGNFNCTLSGGLKGISGNFTDVPKR